MRLSSKALPIALATLLGPIGAKAATSSACPAHLVTVVEKMFPAAKLGACTHEKEHGREEVDVHLTTAQGHKVEVDLALDGTLIKTEVAVELTAVPAAVMTGLTAKFPKAKATRAEKQTHADGKVFYEVEFADGKARREGTFTEAGVLVDVE